MSDERPASPPSKTPPPAGTKLEQAVAAMRHAVSNRELATFALPENRFHKQKRKRDELVSRRVIKRQIRPANARELVEQLPAPDEILHALLRGDFVLGDAIPLILERVGKCPHLRIATLGLSIKNAETLASLVKAGQVGKLSLLCSHYFRAVDKTTTFHAVRSILEPIAEIKVARCHAKIILLPTEAGGNYVIETSANLRSCDNAEQLTAFNDAELLAFHAAWMEEIPGNVK